MAFPIYSDLEFFEESKRNNYRKFLKEVSTKSDFYDDKWFCDKRIKSSNEPLNYSTIRFISINHHYKNIFKYYAVIRLINTDTISTVSSRIEKLRLFTNFLIEQNILSLKDIDLLTYSMFKDFVDNRGLANNTKNAIFAEISSFLKTMKNFDNLNLKNPFVINPYKSDTLLDYKYIPDFVTDKLDKIFMNEEVEVHLRLAYWILRLIPSRISEVLAMKIDCLKPFDDKMVLFIPTWKQNGGHREPILKSIYLEDVGIAKYLLDLIKSQKEISTAMQFELQENKQGYLFSYRRVLHYKNGGNSDELNGMASVATRNHIINNFKRICEMYNIKDENGQIYNLTTHKLRHNGITDRLIAGFSIEQIRHMTLHRGDAMIYNAYAHLNLKPQVLLEKQRKVHKESTKDGYIMFNGRILGMEEMLEKRLLKNIRALRVPGGICSDFTDCKSDMWNCLECFSFIPNADDLGYFKEQVVVLKDKLNLFKKMPIIYENTLKHIKSFEDIIEKIEKGSDLNE